MQQEVLNFMDNFKVFSARRNNFWVAKLRYPRRNLSKIGMPELLNQFFLGVKTFRFAEE